MDDYRNVGDPQALERAGLFVAEGRLVVERLLEDGRFRVHSIAVTPAAAAAMRAVFDRRPDVTVHVCEPAELEAVSGFDFHRGCVALAYRESPKAVEDFVAARRLLAVEGVGNPDNVGGLFRTALAFGVEGILLDPSSGDPFYRKAVRTSMAATLRVPFARVSPWPGGLSRLREAGFRIVALTPHPDAVTLDEYAPRAGERLVLAVGSEGDGLRQALLESADARVRIPIDPRADSLNVVTAAAVALNRLLVR